ncbi:hypothetical protein [Thiocapsa sp.]|uniref:hypothetical protein n=1 Tax=Thiocapsa sp. TaxID=2024551 RepID=UPI003593E334
MSTATLILLDVNFAEISQRHAAFLQPTVERQCVPCLDVDDVCREPLLDQRGDKRTEIVCQRTGGATDECRGTFIR